MSRFTKNPDHEFGFDTLQLHVGQESPDPATDARAVPIYQTTSYVFRNSQHAADRFGLADAGNIYGRLTNSTQGVLEDRIAALEGGVAALAVASGAAAITLTVQALARAGAHVVAQKTIYGGTYNLLAHTLADFGVETTFVNIHDLAEVEAAIRPETTLVYLETLGNPNSDIPDIDAVSALAHAHGLPVVVDNTFGTPYLIRPLEHAPISWCIRRLSSWAVTGRAWVASSSTAGLSTGPWAVSSRRLPPPTRAITGLRSPMRRALLPLPRTYAPSSCAMRAPASHPSTRGFCCRVSRHFRCASTVTLRTRSAWLNTSPPARTWPR